jgi:hypothetical protein
MSFALSLRRVGYSATRAVRSFATSAEVSMKATLMKCIPDAVDVQVLDTSGGCGSFYKVLGTYCNVSLSTPCSPRPILLIRTLHIVVSNAFDGKGRLARHRMVTDALKSDIAVTYAHPHFDLAPSFSNPPSSAHTLFKARTNA